jgi:hypothetical protein
MRIIPLILALAACAVLLAATSAAAGTPSVLWHRHHTDVIYTSTGVAGPSETVFAGTYWMSPRQVEAVPLGGDGTPDWVYPGTQFFVDASRDGGLLAAVDFNSADSSATITAWTPGSSAPLWTTTVSPCRVLTYQGWASRKPIQVSDDGSTIAVGLSMYGGGGTLFSRLYVFGAGSSTPASTYDLTATSIVAVELTPDGSYAALAAWPTVLVYDCNAGALRWSGSIGSGNDALAISADGDYLAWGWSTFYLRQWNGSSYASMWTTSRGSGWYVGQCAFSNDGSLFALSWDNGSTTPNKTYLDLYQFPSLVQQWEYDYGSGAGTSTDIPSRMLFSNDNDHLAVASWGGTFPEVHVFHASESTPVFTLDTPGSMFDVDILTAPDGTTYAAACGKDVHAGTGGRGGDLYAIEIPGAAAGVPAIAASATPVTLGASYPNPFTDATLITCAAPGSAPVRLSIYDTAGRLVKRLQSAAASEAGDGLRAVRWTGVDESGRRVPPGVYLVRAESAAGTGTGKLMLVR